MLATLIQRYDKVSFHFKIQRLTEILQVVRCYILLLYLYHISIYKTFLPVFVLLFVALWFIIRGDWSYVLPCVILFLCFSVL